MESAEVTLLKRCKTNERAAFEALFLQYEKYVYRFCFQFTNKKDDALDLSHDIFIKVIRQMHTVDESKPFLPWLKKICLNTCLNFKRDSKQSLSLDEVMTDEGVRLSDAVASQFNLEEYVIFSETSALIRKCLQKIDEKYRIPLILRHEQNLTYDEISQLLNLPLGTVKVNIFRGRRMLQTFLQEQGIWGVKD